MLVKGLFNINPKITVILPVYQVENYVGNCILSLTKQSFRDFEIILVDDGCKDNSINIAIGLIKKSNIYYKVISQKNKGVAAARNVGIKNASGKYFICIDPDDCLHSRFFETLFNIADRNKINLVACNFLRFSETDNLLDSNEKIKIKYYKKIDAINEFLIRKLIIISPGMLLNTEFIRRSNFYYNEKVSFSEDILFIWRVLFAVESWIFVESKLYYYLTRPNSTMTASSIDKIMTGYNGFCEFTSSLKGTCHEQYAQSIKSRWIFGTLHSASKMLKYGDYKALAKKMCYKSYIRQIMKFNDIRVEILGMILKFNLSLFYFISKRI